MNKSASENRSILLASIALIGAVAALVVTLLSLAPTARGGAGSSALYPRTIKLTDGTQNIVLVLSRVDISPHQSWYRVRLPILPNNKTGYVQRRNLSSLFIVHTHLYVNRGS